MNAGQTLFAQLTDCLPWCQRHELCDHVTDNFRIIDPADFRAIAERERPTPIS